MKKLLAFHGKQEIKDKYLARVQVHYDADEIIQGQYWDGGKGCAVGCTLHSDNHSAYETELGIPRVLARLEDGIFEGLPNDIAKEFPLRFLNAPKVGSDLSLVFPKFMHWLLVDEEHGIIRFSSNKKVTQDVADLYERKISGENIHVNEWLSVRKNASDAASAAASAAAYAAASAASAADAYAYAARQNSRVAQADKLIELITKTRADATEFCEGEGLDETNSD